MAPPRLPPSRPERGRRGARRWDRRGRLGSSGRIWGRGPAGGAPGVPRVGWPRARGEHKVARGEPGVASRVHLLGLTSDLVRSAALAALGLAAAALLDYAPRLDVGTERALAIVVVAGGFVAVIGGALRRAGTLRRMVWLAGGMALGALGLGLS